MTHGLKFIIDNDTDLRKEFYLPKYLLIKEIDQRNREILAAWDALSYFDDDPKKKIGYSEKILIISKNYFRSTDRIRNIINAAIEARTGIDDE